jgi:hypothetical protein
MNNRGEKQSPLEQSGLFVLSCLNLSQIFSVFAFFRQNNKIFLSAEVL